MWGPTSINHFQNLHDYYLKKKPIVHAYATPYHNDPATDPAAMWSFVMHEKRDLERKLSRLTFIHKVTFRMDTMTSVT